MRKVPGAKKCKSWINSLTRLTIGNKRLRQARRTDRGSEADVDESLTSSRPFNLTISVYQPKPAMLDGTVKHNLVVAAGTYQIPPVRRVH